MDYANDNTNVKTELDQLNLPVPDDVLDLCSPFLPCEIIMKNHWMEGNNIATMRPMATVDQHSNLSPHSSHILPDTSSSVTSTEELLTFNCTICSYVANGINDLRDHQRDTHEKCPEKQDVFVCRQCDFCTTMKRNLIRHEKNHSDKKRYSCDQCDYQNNSRVLLNKHKRNHDINFKNSKFKCPVCEFGSNDKDEWKRHIVLHEKVRLHECELCDYATTKLSDIKRHRGMHAKNDPASQPTQPLNGFTFTKTENVPHSPNQSVPEGGGQKFMCNHCDYSTHYRSLLSSHLLSHEECKELCCPECGYKTNYKFRLRNHMRTHMPDKPYKCSQCDFETKHKVSLPRHILNCHKDISIITYK